MGKKKDNDFEQDLRRLEEISGLLESDSVSLEEALSLYEEGIQLSRNCIAALKKAELKITELKKNLDKLNLEEDVQDE
jgi:exodeoxyribonuclease VII small subunit